MKKLFTLATLWGAAACASAAAPVVDASMASSAETVQVMVIGSFYMGNPGQDVANADIENMLTAKRQAEIAAVSDALKAFKPNVVAVERITDAPAYIDPKFEAFTPEMLVENADERYQIGYRLANETGISRVYGIDEQPSEGEPDYFPFDKLMAHAEATGQGDTLTQQITEVQAQMADFGAMQKDNTVAGLLLALNEGEMSSPDFYYRTFEFDRGEAQPGAELQAYWFMRNAKIFSKLAQVTKPGDRVVVVYGAGHKFWLDHFADHTPGFSRVDPIPYLEKADR
ncbi:DUF5694 domain-containing protein [Hyphococcus sp.]|uniref:DUF5694 domain-containing protein n=1 Tax=Hyphococcus sp. TaxID=2038636 RepID=UPI002084D9A2|nr:MAG: hypothetical protein DHS20C04_07890 [Marinicaulis sp.]